MGITVHRVLGEALKLSPDERAHVVTELLATLEPEMSSQQRTDADWIQELERRARVAEGGVPAVSWTDARVQIQSRLSTS
ncbi:MAG: addiction module protein [Egibacteraceae bacterium]